MTGARVTRQLSTEDVVFRIQMAQQWMHAYVDLPSLDGALVNVLRDRGYQVYRSSSGQRVRVSW